MSLLTDREISSICNGWPGNAEKAARAIEQAVLRKLATVGVEPVAFHAQDGIDFLNKAGINAMEMK